MPDPLILHDDYGDAIVIDSDGAAAAAPGDSPRPPAVLIGFWDSPFQDGGACAQMRLSGERLAAFTEALDRYAAHVEGLADGVR